MIYALFSSSSHPFFMESDILSSISPYRSLASLLSPLNLSSLIKSRGTRKKKTAPLLCRSNNQILLHCPISCAPLLSAFPILQQLIDDISYVLTAVILRKEFTDPVSPNCYFPLFRLLLSKYQAYHGQSQFILLSVFL